ncbi:hypothetical protein AXW83_15425 [Bosea sp. PAMC 26642]|nr:hypothetical protein AXW83_15425 [Bosea sp. PAMC 26642]
MRDIDGRSVHAFHPKKSGKVSTGIDDGNRNSNAHTGCRCDRCVEETTDQISIQIRRADSVIH